MKNKSVYYHLSGAPGSRLGLEAYNQLGKKARKEINATAIYKSGVYGLIRKDGLFMGEKIKRGIIISACLMLIGLGYVGYYIVAQIQYTQFVADCETCEAVVTKTVRDYHRNNFIGLEDVYIAYTVGDTEYCRTLSTDTKIAFSKVITNFDVGEKVTIYYKPENPEKIATPESNKNGLLAAISGFIVFVFGLVLLINYIKKYKKEKTQTT